MAREAWSQAIAQAAERIYQVRETIRQLELEEGLLREAVLTALKDVPETDFPVRLGTRDVRVVVRNGRIDEVEAARLLATRGLGEHIENWPEVRSAPDVRRLETGIGEWSMPAKTRAALAGAFGAAIQYRPRVDAATLAGLRRSGLIDEDLYRACFKDGHTEIRMLTVR